MNTRSKHTSIPTKNSAAVFRSIVAAGVAAMLVVVGSPTILSAAPPSAEDDIDYAASGFMLPPGVNPSAWSTAAGVSAVGGMNYASQPAVSGPMLGGQMPTGPMVAAPGIGGPMMGNTPLAQTIPSSFPSGPIPGMPVPTGLQGPIGPAAYQAAMQSPYGHVMPISYQDGGMGGQYQVYDGGYADSYGYACSSCDGGSCDGAACGSCGGGGGGFNGILPALMGKCGSCNGQGCGICNSSLYQSGCLGKGGMLGDWCSGKCMQGDFGLLMGTIGGNVAAICDAIKPYSEAGKCAQRWYDVSVEAMFLGHNFTQDDMVISTLGVSGTPQISLSDAKVGDLEAGVRVSAAMIMGVGGNLEMVYVGGHEWSNTAQAAATSTVAPNLYSYISNYGVTPAGGYDDPDQSLTHSVTVDSVFHSGELNYRRRTVGPGCRFQGSWLGGFRYLRLDNGFGFNAVGTLTDGAGNVVAGTPGGPGNDELRFYNSSTLTKNNLFVGQIGYDVWWNMMPGIQLGFGMKGGWGQNDWERNTYINANSAGVGATAGVVSISDRDRLCTVMGEIETKLVYRFSHSWSLRTAHHLIAIDDVLDTVPSAGFVQNSLTTVSAGNQVTTPPAASFSSVVMQGFTIGAEYIW
ncbi:BBP7 family outer membrane beta-barrel protein [Aporhodopirellula aestuarii]|uniref:BBP7 family outer membrane beta-barrel protein n=1 Tax=Aporhodopirellula aestuarii TaxID=2950107 RepID=A0ABT0U7S8_9BACT|nr:BBP7 family outer membrane beta-barrel protein [Aporhodopirellula aestuarii]MCM2372994.1 BBP7 family outer membrane beta-barrel protein [Aporhodopirellula aestuarii]